MTPSIIDTPSQAPKIQRLNQLPRFQALLSHGDNAFFQLMGAQKDAIVALGLGANRYAILSTTEARGSPAWFSLIQQAKRAGYEMDRTFICEASVIKLLLDSKTSSDEDELRKIELKNRDVLDSIVADSSHVNWFKEMVGQCIELEATDIHLESRGGRVDVRIRRDGLMRTIMRHPEQTVLQALSACYTLIAEESSRSEVAFNMRAAQSAVIPLDMPKQRVALRYQSHPTANGFDVVMRVLRSERDRSALALTELGYTSQQTESLQRSLATATGGVFIAGVTGSGKTTTLSSMLAQLASDGHRKIVAIEDPVEYQVPGVSHLSVQRSLRDSPEVNAFSQAMMAFLRMDPDVGMFGEIRDHVSGQMAYTAIQTGHKLLTTVHATSALGIVARLTSTQIGMLRSDICTPEFFSALVYQTLIPKNCPHCSEPAEKCMSPEALSVYGARFMLDPSAMRVASESGCPHCRPPGLGLSEAGHNGVLGVKVCAEVIEPDLALLDMLRRGEDIKAREHWRAQRAAPYTDADMSGKPAWAHGLYDMSQGLIDPFHFERAFGAPEALLRY